MKYILYFLSIITFVFCGKKSIIIPQSTEDIMPDKRKNFLECIFNSENISENLKNYVNECLKSDLKEPLNFYKLKLLKTERDAIARCKKDMFTIKNKANPKTIKKGILKNYS